jgi:hypothetical protein
MHLHTIDYVVWGLAPVIQVGILWAIYARGLYREYPFFALYQLVQVLSEPVLFVMQRHSYSVYYWGYYISVALSALVSAAVLCEVVRSPFRTGALSRRTAFLFATSVSIVFAVTAACMVTWVSTSAPAVLSSSIDQVTNTILLAQRSVRLLQCGFILLLMISWKSLRMPRRDPLFGIMLGFGVFATVSMIFAAAVSHGTFVHISTLRLINSVAYLVACVIWLVSVLRAPAQTGSADRRLRLAI